MVIRPVPRAAAFMARTVAPLMVIPAVRPVPFRISKPSLPPPSPALIVVMPAPSPVRVQVPRSSLFRIDAPVTEPPLRS